MVANYLSRQAGEASLFVSHIALLSTVARHVKVGLEGRDACLRKEPEPLGQGYLSVMLAVIIRTVRLLAAGCMLARLHLEEVRMVLLFFPAVRVQTLILICAALLVRADKIIDLPLRTHLATV